MPPVGYPRSRNEPGTKPHGLRQYLFWWHDRRGVDIATGAAYDYPELIVVEVGQVFEPSAKLEEGPKTALVPAPSSPNQTATQAPLP